MIRNLKQLRIRSVDSRLRLCALAFASTLVALNVHASLSISILAPRCQALFGAQELASPGIVDEPVYGSFRKDFKFDDHYTVEVSKQSEVRDQCGLGTCHLHSWVSMLEQHRATLSAEPNVADIKISSHYLAAQQWLDRTLQALDDRTSQKHSADEHEKFEIRLGANVFVSRKAIQKFGLVPDGVWTARRDFQDSAKAERIKEYLSNIVVRALYNASHEYDLHKKSVIIENAKQQIRDVFANTVGEFPKQFEYRGRSYTPVLFMNTFFSEIHRPITRLAVGVEVKSQPDSNYNLFQSELETPDEQRLASVDAIEVKARQLVDRNQSVYLSYDNNKAFINKKLGIMSIDAFHVPDGAKPLPISVRRHYNLNGRGHAVQIVGYELDPSTGKVLKWKIKNSWGVDSGDNGYYHMYRDYFRTFVTGIAYFSDADEPSAIH